MKTKKIKVEDIDYKLKPKLVFGTDYRLLSYLSNKGFRRFTLTRKSKNKDDKEIVQKTLYCKTLEEAKALAEYWSGEYYQYEISLSNIIIDEKGWFDYQCSFSLYDV